MEKYIKPLLFYFSFVFAAQAASEEGATFQLLPAYPLSRTVLGEGAGREARVLLGYRMPCGWHFAGIFMQEKSPTELNVGVIARRRPVSCLGLEQAHVIALPLRAGGYARVQSFAARTQIPIERMPIAEQIAVLGDSRDQQIKVLYRGSSCRTNAGLVLTPSGANEFQVGIAEAKVRGVGPEVCKATPRLVRVNHVTLGAVPGLSLKTPKPIDLRYASTYGIATVDLTTVRQTEVGVSLSYARRCNEAPIGIVIQSGRERSRLGMLVARFYNMSCPKDGPKWLRSRFEVAGLKLDMEPKMAALPAVDGRSFDISVPVWIHGANKGQLKTTVATLGACEQSYGLVAAAAKAKNQVNIAGLVIRANGTCRRDFATTRLAMPAVILPDFSLMPLRLAHQ